MTWPQPKRLFRNRPPVSRDTLSPRRHELLIGAPGLLYALTGYSGAPGEFVQLVTLHDADCRYPSGAPCTCVAGPETITQAEFERRAAERN